MLVKRSFTLAGHRTSVALETEFWDVLARCANARGIALSTLVAELDNTRPQGQPLASALRVYALHHAASFNDRTTSAEAHSTAGENTDQRS